MKKIFIALAALATIAACNKAEVIETQEGEQIAFSNAFVENTTKAAVDPSLGTTANPFKKFNVWGTVGGVPIYAGAEVTGEVGSTTVDDKEVANIWTCTSVKQYWVKDAHYKFSALATSSHDHNEESTCCNVTLGEEDKLPAKITVDATAANVDLLYAEPVERTGVASGNEPVEFTFKHLLSKVKFTVKNNSQDATDYSFDVKDITITCPKRGTIKLADKTWENLSSAAAYTVQPVTVDNSLPSKECENELLLIPGTVSINYAVDIKCGGETIATYNLAEPHTPTLVGGHSYNFIVRVSVGEEITFSVDDNPSWIDSEVIF